jgi:hypothetical protein
MGFKFNPFTGNFDQTDSPDGVFESVEVDGDITLDDGGTYTTTLQTVTATANRTISFPDATGTIGLVAGSSGQAIYNDAGAYSGLSTVTTDGTDITLSGRFISSLNGAASAPPGAFTGTWFTGGTATTTKPQVLIEPTGSTSTAWNTNGTGLGVNAASGFAGKLLDLQVNGTSVIRASGTGGNNGLIEVSASGASFSGIQQNSSRGYGFYSGIVTLRASDFIGLVCATGAFPVFIGASNTASNRDTPLYRDAAGILASRDGTNAQTYRLYNTFTSATNFERAKLEWDTNVLKVGTEKGADGGTARDMELQTDGVTRLKADTIGSLEVATALTVATLPSSPVVGMLARVTDADAPTLGATVVGGESDNALVWYNGTNWTVIGV